MLFLKGISLFQRLTYELSTKRVRIYLNKNKIKKKKKTINKANIEKENTNKKGDNQNRIDWIIYKKDSI